MYSKTLLIQINWGSKLSGLVEVWIKQCTHKVTYSPALSTIHVALMVLLGFRYNGFHEYNMPWSFYLGELADFLKYFFLNGCPD